MTPPLDDDFATAHPGYVAVHLSARGGGPFLKYQKPKRMSGALVASVGAHVLGVIGLLLLSQIQPEFDGEGTLPERAPRGIVWLAQPGPGGGGGGGGNQMKEPPRKMELPGRDQITVPVIKPAEPVPVEAPQPNEDVVPEPEINIPAKPMAAGVTTAVGAIDSTSAATASQGSGSGGGAGTGTGTGSGSGQGSGLGAGFGGGTGGGAYQPGNGVSAPKLLKIVQPQYTADAMRAKVQGVVVLECIVMPDGTVAEARVKRSLPFGLDDEAIKAARQWRFSPGLRQGEPVPVIIAIELSFSLR
jgi:TonB family protein